MNYVGADLHKQSTWFYVMNESGKRIISKSIPNNPELLHSFFREIPAPFILAVEATYNWYFFVDIAENYADERYLANSYELKAFAKRHKKTDKIDARLIADVLRKGYLPIVYTADKGTRMKREFLRYRINIVNDRSRNIFRLKGLLDKLGENSNGDFVTYKRLKEIETEHLSESYQKIIRGYIERIIELRRKEYESEKHIEKIAMQDEDIMNLKTLRGLDYFSAMLIKTEIIDIERFKSFNRLCAYAGLSPRVNQSGNKCMHGQLNKNSRKYLRWILLETVFHYIKGDEKRVQKFESISKKKGYNTAKVVMARDMLKMVYHILKEKRPYYANKKEKAKIRSEVACALQGV